MNRVVSICQRGLVVAVMAVSLGCQPSKIEMPVLSGSTMGTTYSVKVTSLPADSGELESEIVQILERINARMSTYRPESELSLFNRHDGLAWFELSGETAWVIREALSVSRSTLGSFDPTVAPWVDLWNFGPNRRERGVPTDEQITRVSASVGRDLLEVRLSPPAVRRLAEGVKIDLSGIAKGYAVDQLAELLENRGVKGFMIEIGGEVRVRGSRSDGRSWAIGIETPDDGRPRPFKVLHLRKAAVATSGDYRNYYVADGTKMSHLIDPSTGRPVTDDLASVSVVDPSCARADAMATALMVMGPVGGYDHAVRNNVSALFVLRTEQGFIDKMTPTFQELFEGQHKPR